MKRSEMILKLTEGFQEHSNNQQYKGYSHEGLAETFLDLVLMYGMKPPYSEAIYQKNVRVAIEPTGYGWDPESD